MPSTELTLDQLQTINGGAAFMKLGDIKGELQTTDITSENRFFAELIQGTSVASTNPVLELSGNAGPGGSTYLTAKLGTNSGPGGSTYTNGTSREGL